MQALVTAEPDGIDVRSGQAVPYVGSVITYQWRGPFANAEVNALHAEGFGHQLLDDDWQAQLERHSLGWVCARDGNDLAGFVNVAWEPLLPR